MPTSSTFEVRPLNNVGAEVLGLDINKPLTAATQAELKTLWYEHAILLFRGQDITPQKTDRVQPYLWPTRVPPLASEHFGTIPGTVRAGKWR